MRIGIDIGGTKIEAVAIDEVRLDWSWCGIVSGRLDVEALIITGARVDLRGDFADLTIPGPSTPSTTIGPSLPLDLNAERIHL